MGNIYATVAPVAGIGTPGVTQVTQFGTVNNSFVSGGPLQNPVAVAVDASKNVYVADSNADAIYKFDSLVCKGAHSVPQQPAHSRHCLLRPSCTYGWRLIPTGI